MCPRKVIRVYSGCQGEHIQQILKLLSSPRQPFVGQGKRRQVALGSVGQHSSLSLVVSRHCHYIVLQAGAFDGLSIPLSQHSQQHLDK